MNRRRAALLYRKLAQSGPEPRSELNFDSPFQLLVAVILSAQATDISVNKATALLFPRHGSSPESLLRLGAEGLLKAIRTIGLAPTKSRYILAVCRILLDQHGGAVPAERTALEALPGVGRKTANVVLNVAFGRPTIAVDTHVFRVANRTGLARGKNEIIVEEGLLAITPGKYLKQAHHYLILHGRYCCKARNPACTGCVINRECEHPEKSTDKKPL